MSSNALMYDIRQEDVKIIQEVYDAFISSHKRNSIQTATNYDTRIKEFFKLITGKEIKFLSVKDIGYKKQRRSA